MRITYSNKVHNAIGQPHRCSSWRLVKLALELLVEMVCGVLVTEIELSLMDLLGGHLKPDPIYRASSVLETHGKEVAEHVSSFEARHVDAIKDLVEREGIDCDFEKTKVHDVCFYDAGQKQTEATLARLVQAGISTAKVVQCLSGMEAEKVCPLIKHIHDLPSRSIDLRKRRLTVHTGVWCQRSPIVLDLQCSPTLAL